MRAIDFIKQLEQNAEYVKQQLEKEEKMNEKASELKIIEEPFINDLNINRIHNIKNAGDLLKLKKIDDKLAKLLLKWIPKIDDKYNFKEILIRALAVSEGSIDGGILMQLFDNEETSPSLKWAIGNTIACANVKDVSIWLQKKFTALKVGKEHEMLVYALVKYLDHRKACEILRRIFDTYPLQAADAFSMIGDYVDLEYLEKQSGNYTKELRTGINKSIKKLKVRLSRNSR
jgi:hypothetical protein